MSKGKLIETTDVPGTKRIGTLTLHGMDTMNKKGRSKVATWLRNQARLVEDVGGKDGEISSRYTAKYHVLMSIMSLCLLVSGCADTMKMYDLGSMWKQEHHIPPTLTKGPSTEYIKCNKKAVTYSDKWQMDLCAGTLDPSAPLAYEASQYSGPSYAAMVLPGLASSVPLGLGLGLGLAHSGNKVTQTNNNSAAGAPAAAKPGPWRPCYNAHPAC